MKIEDNPIYRLAKRVQNQELSLLEAKEQAKTPEFQQRVTDDDIAEVNAYVHNKLPRSEVNWAFILSQVNLAVTQPRPSDAWWVNCNITVGWIQMRRGYPKSALGHYLEAQKFPDEMAEVPPNLTIRVQLDVGELHERLGDLVAAEEAFDTVLEYLRTINELDYEREAKLGLGRIQLAQGNADTALKIFSSVFTSYTDSSDLKGKGLALGNMGLAYFYLGSLREAEKQYREALALSRTEKDRVNIGRHLDHLGSVRLEMGKYAEAENHFKEALAIAQELQDAEGEEKREGNLGVLYLAQSEQLRNREQREHLLAQAFKHQQKAVGLARFRQDEASQVAHLTHLGKISQDRGNTQEARSYYQEALTLAQAQQLTDRLWRIHYAWGYLCQSQKQYRDAFEHYAMAVRIVRRQRRQLVTESRKEFWQQRSFLYKQMALCCFRLGKLWLALRYTEAAKTRYLADLMAQTGVQPPAGYSLLLIKKAINGLPDETAVVVFNVTMSGTLLFILDLQAKGKQRDEIGDEWLVSKDGRLHARLLPKFTQNHLQRDVKAYLRLYGSAEFQSSPEHKWGTWGEINQSLLAPIEQRLATIKPKRLILMTNLGLSLLPLHAARRPDTPSRPHLIDRYVISYVPSFFLMRRCQETTARPTTGNHLFAVANPTKDLPGAAIEVERMTTYFPDHQIWGHENSLRATPETVLHHAPQGNVVHFACHGQFDLQQPEQSALLLARPGPTEAPGRLTLQKIIEQLHLPKTRLVVASACETGLVDPGDLADEYVSLPAGFIYAGAPMVISTLWQVDDISTTLLTERFYYYHIHKNLPPSEALRHAQRWLRDVTLAPFKQYNETVRHKFPHFYVQLEQIRRELLAKHGGDEQQRPFSHPYFWAAFTMTGV